MRIVKTFEALLAGPEFPGDEVRWNRDAPEGTRTVLTYSFPDGEETARIGAESAGFEKLAPFDDEEKAAFRRAADIYSRDTGLMLVEVPDDGALRPMAASGTGWAGLARFPLEAFAYAPIAISRDEADLPGGMAKGSRYFTTILHEIGHAVGLKHPHDGETRLIEHWDNTNQTVMSYGDVIPYMPNLRRIDLDALRHLYGERDGLEVRVDADGGLRARGDESDDEAIFADRAVILRAGAGDDRAWGSDEDDVLAGEAGDDRMIGRDGDDALRGQAGNDRLLGGAGDDLARGGGGDDRLKGGGGDDRLKGEAGADRLLGGRGEDRLAGGGADDALRGGGGDDMLIGGGGDDLIAGGRGDDVLVGRAGADAFVFNRGDGADVIRGFDVAEDFLVLDRAAGAFEDRGNGVAMIFANGDEILFRGLDMDDAGEIVVDALIA